MPAHVWVCVLQFRARLLSVVAWVLCCVNPDLVYFKIFCFQPVLPAKDQTLQRLLGLLGLFAAERGVIRGGGEIFF